MIFGGFCFPPPGTAVNREDRLGFGERMQREREMRGITLEEIATATKIGARSLRALEQEEFDKLPGGIFNKGFVRSYARYLGIDEDQAVADYLAAIGEPAEEDSTEAERLKKLGTNWKPTSSPPSDRSLIVPWRGLMVFLLLAVAVFLAVYYRHSVLAQGRRWLAKRHAGATAESFSTPAVPAPLAAPGDNPAAPRSSPSPSPLPASSPVPTTEAIHPSSLGEAVPVASNSSANSSLDLRASSSVKAAESGPVDSGPEFVVIIRAKEDTWLKVTADGKAIMKGTLSATRETTIRARQKITVLAGNAGGIDLSFNGTPQPPLGADKQVRTITFTNQGMQE